MKKTKTTQLTLGAILTAVFLILHLVIPGGQKSLQGMLLIITFLPTAIYCLGFGFRKTAVMVAAGLLLSGLLLPPEVFLSFAAPALVIGLAAGLTYGKRRRLTVILLLSTLFLVQNIAEAVIYYLLTQINPVDTYVWFVGMVHERIPAHLLQDALFSRFLEDFLLCAVPCMAVLVSGAKGVLSFLILKLLHSRLETVMGPEADPRFTRQTKFTGKGISVAYFCAICVCALFTALPFLGMVSYHFVFAAFAALGVLLAVLYTYYFYTVRVRAQEDRQMRLIYSFVLVVTLPVGIFALPLVELYLLRRETQ